MTAPLSRSVRDLGREVTAIGDSVMLAAAPQIESALPGSYIDAQVSRQMGQGVTVAQQLAASGQLRPVVVVGLGTNGPITMAQVRMLRAVAGPWRALVFVTTFVPRPWQAEVNAVLAAASRQYHDITLANWLAAIRRRTNLLWSDGVHPRPAGSVLYAQTMASAVLRAARDVGNEAGAGQPGAHPAGG